MTESFDFIVVGAGSAGCVLANRLSADPLVRVLLLEAGSRSWRPEVKIPAAFYRMFKSRWDWAFVSEPDPSVGGRSLFIPRGKTLGGSSSINAMIYVRGHPDDYDGWARQAPGWSYREVLPIFRKSESFFGGESAFHGGRGELVVSEQRSPHRLSHLFVEAAVQTGIRPNADFNGEMQDGVGLYHVTQRDGRRWSAADAFLTPIRRRPNLRIVCGAITERIVIDRSRAVGARYVVNGRIMEARAEREVILCAGAIGSPRVLLSSGIGPADELERAGIDPILDSRDVGKHLQDHPVVGVLYRTHDVLTLDRAETLANVIRYYARRDGPLSSNVAEAGGFIRTDASLSAPNLQFHFVPGYMIQHGFVRPEDSGFTIGPTLLTPKSRGYVALRSADPFDSPKIHGNYLSDESDVKALLAGVEISRAIAAAVPFDGIRGDEVVPGKGLTGSDMERFVRESVEMLYHPTGTCRMGSDPGAVVDPGLRVNGIERLRVADASVMPSIIRGNTNAAVIMIAEKAAELILSSSTTASR